MLGWCFASAWTALGTQSAHLKHAHKASEKSQPVCMTLQSSFLTWTCMRCPVLSVQPFASEVISQAFCTKYQTSGETFTCLSQTGEGFLLTFDSGWFFTRNATRNGWPAVPKLESSWRILPRPMTRLPSRGTPRAGSATPCTGARLPRARSAFRRGRLPVQL